MPELNMGTTDWCQSCSKERDHVVDYICISCRIHYKTATPDEIEAWKYGQEMYKLGFLRGRMAKEV